MDHTSVAMGISAQQHRVAIGGYNPPDLSKKICKKRRQYDRQQSVNNLLAVEGIKQENGTIWETLFFAIILPCVIAAIGCLEAPLLITLFGYCLEAPNGNHISVESGLTILKVIYCWQFCRNQRKPSFF